MTAIARALSRAFPKTHVAVKAVKFIAMFCGVGLVVFLLLATNGLDMSAGFFCALTSHRPDGTSLRTARRPQLGPKLALRRGWSIPVPPRLSKTLAAASDS